MEKAEYTVNGLLFAQSRTTARSRHHWRLNTKTRMRPFHPRLNKNTYRTAAGTQETQGSRSESYSLTLASLFCLSEASLHGETALNWHTLLL